MFSLLTILSPRAHVFCRRVYHPFITFHKNKAYNILKLSFLKPEESFVLYYAQRYWFVMSILTFYDKLASLGLYWLFLIHN
jgi:hypothetical protein